MCVGSLDGCRFRLLFDFTKLQKNTPLSNITIDFDCLAYGCQYKEEVSSGGDQLTSNRIGAYTKKEGRDF